MTVRTVNNLPAATHGETVRCLFAIELSKQSWVIGFNTPLSEKISRRTLSGCDWKGLLELIEDVRARVSREMGRAVAVMSCYEAGYDGFWLHRQLEAHGVRNYVIDPASLQVDREASTHLQNLHKLKAIGPEFAAVLVGEIFHRSFDEIAANWRVMLASSVTKGYRDR